jgi:uncharacterized protein YndB with AHSA1/START domain
MSMLLDKDGVRLDESTVRFERLLPGPIERIWTYLTDSEKRKMWIAAGDMELRKGGKTHWFFQHKNIAKQGSPVPEAFKKVHQEGHVMNGEVLTIDPPRLLSMTWGEHSEVTFELTEQSNSDVLLTVTHRKLTLGDMKNVMPGWHAHLGLLADLLNGRDPGDFWVTWQQMHTHYGAQLTK